MIAGSTIKLCFRAFTLQNRTPKKQKQGRKTVMSSQKNAVCKVQKRFRAAGKNEAVIANDLVAQLVVSLLVMLEAHAA